MYTIFIKKRCHLKQAAIYFIFSLIFLSSAIAEESIDPELPQVIIIGAQKSGTSAFYQLLCQHPQIVDRPGEIHFFDLNFDKGVEWYKAQFPQSKSPKTIRVDKSPYYLFHPLAVQRMHAVLPHAKLIVLLRNPIDRAYSHYWMNIRRKTETLCFLEAIEQEEERLAEENMQKKSLSSPRSNYRIYSYLSRGRYVGQLERWFKFYPPEQILILSFNDFLKNPTLVMQEALAFLGLSQDYDFRFEVGKKNSYPPMDPSLRKELSDYFRPYNKDLEVLLNKRFYWD